MALACAREDAAPELQLRFEQRLQRSRQLAEQRLAALPQPEFPSGLPVVERLDQVRQAIADNQVIVLCGETGSGKSTQLPKICLSLGLGVYGLSLIHI